MDIDGSNRRNLTSNKYYDDWPAVSPGGNRIAFLSIRRDTDGDGEVNSFVDARELYVMNRDGSDQVRVSLDGVGVEGPPRWSPDGSLIAFTALKPFTTTNPYISVPGQSRVLQVVSANGSNQQQLAEGLNEWTEFAWAPDSGRIAFGGEEIVVVHTDGRPEAPLVSACPYPVFDPAWSPDGREIAFVCAEQPAHEFPVTNDEIRLMDADGSGEITLLGSLGAFDDGRSSLRWSPDGRWIAFRSWVGGRNDLHGRSRCGINEEPCGGNLYLYVVDSEGKAVQLVAYAGLGGLGMTTFAWSASGEWLLFDRPLNSLPSQHILAVHASRMAPHQLVGDQYEIDYYMHPAWF
jgi:TolB protein